MVEGGLARHALVVHPLQAAGGEPATDATRLVEQLHRVARVGQVPGQADPGNAGTDHRDAQ